MPDLDPDPSSARLHLRSGDPRVADGVAWFRRRDRLTAPECVRRIVRIRSARQHRGPNGLGFLGKYVREAGAPDPADDRAARNKQGRDEEYPRHSAIHR